MNSIQFGTPLGPQEMQARIAELRRDLSGLSGPTDQQAAGGNFQSMLNSNVQNSTLAQILGSNSPSPLSGSIGTDESNTTANDFGGGQPVNPFAIPGNSSGLQIQPSPISASGTSLPELKAMVQNVALQHGISPALYDALVQQESDYNPMSRSNAGAMGLSQLMPSNVKELGITNPFDPQQNLNGGAKLLRGLLNRFKSVPLALAAYNAGPGAVEKYNGIPPYRETQDYVRKIMAKLEPGTNSGVR